MSEKRVGSLFYNPKIERYDIRFGAGSYYGGLNVGEYFDIKVGAVWVPAQIEKTDDWHLVGMPDVSITGLIVRV